MTLPLFKASTTPKWHMQLPRNPNLHILNKTSQSPLFSPPSSLSSPLPAFVFLHPVFSLLSLLLHLHQEESKKGKGEMLEAAVPSIWASVHSWFTPTVLFVLLNLVIATIAFTSKATRSQQHHEEMENEAQPKLASPRSPPRLPSIVLQHPANAPLETAEPPHAPNAEIVESLHEALDSAAHAVVEEKQDPHLSRSQSEGHPTAGEVPEKLAGKIKKSASDNSAFANFGEAEIVKKLEKARFEEEEEEGQEVDARADDFINGFWQQLKLQRLDSIMRYKEMLDRGK